MAAHYESKHGSIAKSREELYMAFVDLGSLTRTLPEEYRNSVTADYDTLTAKVQGFTIGVKVTERSPYSLIRIEDNDAPFHFSIALHFDQADVPGRTDFYIEVDTELNLMMKAMLGGKIKEGLDKAIDGLEAAL